MTGGEVYSKLNRCSKIALLIKSSTIFLKPNFILEISHIYLLTRYLPDHVLLITTANSLLIGRWFILDKFIGYLEKCNKIRKKANRRIAVL